MCGLYDGLGFYLKEFKGFYGCVLIFKGDKKVVCGTGEGVVDIFNKDEWGNIADRFPGHPSSIDCILPLGESVLLTGCFDGNIR